MSLRVAAVAEDSLSPGPKALHGLFGRVAAPHARRRFRLIVSHFASRFIVAVSTSMNYICMQLYKRACRLWKILGKYYKASMFEFGACGC